MMCVRRAYCHALRPRHLATPERASSRFAQIDLPVAIEIQAFEQVVAVAFPFRKRVADLTGAVCRQCKCCPGRKFADRVNRVMPDQSPLG